MHITKSKLSAVALGVFLLVTLALGTTTARAVETIDNDTLVVYKTSSDDKDFKTDLKTAEVKVDIYKIYDAEPNSDYDAYDYTPVSGVSLGELSSHTDTAGKVDWEGLASAAKALAKKGTLKATKTATINAGAESTQFTGLEDGIYLVLARGSKGDVVETKIYEYTFSPSIVVLPTKEDLNEDGVITTGSEDGDWLDTVEVSFKPERTKKDEKIPPKDTDRKVVRTGDETNLTPLYVAMVVSGVALVLLLTWGYRDRRKNREESTR